MKNILLYQIQEMITNFIEAEHNGAVEITDVSMEDSGYNSDNEKRSLDISIDYISSVSVSESDEEPTATIELDTKKLAANINDFMAEEVRKNMKVTY